VIGLSTAIKLQETGKYNVSVLAETFPTDPKSIRYTSHWAGAHHFSHATEEKQKAINKETFNVFWELSAPGSPTESLFLRHTETEYREDVLKAEVAKTLETMPEFKYLTDLPFERVKAAHSLRTLTIHPPAYLPYLQSRFIAAGGRTVRGSINHIAQVIEGGTHAFDVSPYAYIGSSLTNNIGSRGPHAVIACPGIGARTLGGIMDEKVYPVRGQTLLLKAPWLDYGRVMVEADGTFTYVIPRPGGTVLIGGTRDVNDWYPLPREETSEDILERAFALVPDLADPVLRNGKSGLPPLPSRKHGDVGPPLVSEDEEAIPLSALKANIVEAGCGLRPAREGGVRLDVEWHTAGKNKDVTRIPVVYNYGHGGFGYIASWGSASYALKLLEDALAQGPQQNSEGKGESGGYSTVDGSVGGN